MAEDWTAIAAEVAEGIAEVGFVVALRKNGLKPTDGHQADYVGPTFHELTVIDDNQKIRDTSGNLVKRSTRTLTVAVGGVVPEKKDRIKIKDAVTFLTNPTDFGFTEAFVIDEVRPFEPGGTALLYDIDLIT